MDYLYVQADKPWYNYLLISFLFFKLFISNRKFKVTDAMIVLLWYSLCVLSSLAMISLRKRDLVALL